MCKGKRWFVASLILVSILMLIGWGEQVQSQEKYPTRPIEILLPASAGGSVDLTSRIVAAYLNKKWGVPVNVVNKPGGNYIPGSLEVYHAPPNGYNFLADSQAISSVLGVIVKNLPYKVMDRTFIAIHSSSPFVLFVPSTSPFKTLEDFIAEAKKNPERISWTSLTGGLEIAIRQLFTAIGVDISKTKPVQMRGGSDGVTLAAGGHVTLGSSTASSVLPAIKGGSVRPLLITSRERDPDLPDVPTSKELGYPTVHSLHWNGISGPPKLPSYVVEMWDKALEEMLKDPVVISQLKNVGAMPFYHDSEATREYVKKEMEEVGKYYK